MLHNAAKVGIGTSVAIGAYTLGKFLFYDLPELERFSEHTFAAGYAAVLGALSSWFLYGITKEQDPSEEKDLC